MAALLWTFWKLVGRDALKQGHSPFCGSGSRANRYDLVQSILSIPALSIGHSFGIIPAPGSFASSAFPVPPKPRLRETQRQQLKKLLLTGPEQLGYETPLWTCPRVAHLIEQQFGVRYHEGHCLEASGSPGLEPAAAGRSGTGTQRRADSALEEEGVGGP